MILFQTKLVVIVSAGLFYYSQAIAGGFVDVRSETSVTGGTIVRKDDSSSSLASITIKELDTNRLMRFFFMEGIAVIEGTDNDAGETEVIVDDQPATPDKLKVGMRAQVVFYTSVKPWKGEKTKFMKSVKAISLGKQKPAE
jgi:hypothetical protein